MPTERMIIGPQRVYRDLHELLVKLTVLQFDLNRDVIRKVLGKLERIMNNVGSPRRNLVVIQRSTYILSVTSIYPLALLVQHKHIQKVCPAVHFNGIPPRNVSITLRHLRSEISEWKFRFGRGFLRRGPAPEPPGFLKAWLGCSKVAGKWAGDYSFECLVKRSRALRGRNLARDSQDEGASKTPQASRDSLALEAFPFRLRPAARFSAG